MSNVVSICQQSKFFSLQEAQQLVPLLQRITHRHETAVAKLVSDQQFMIISGASENRINILQEQINKHMIDWGTKVTKLGCKALGGAFIGIDAGGYYWSWMYGEVKIENYHMYNESPLQRRHLTLRVSQPDLVIT